MPVNPLPAGQYRIRKTSAKSEIANLISEGKKCFYVQIGMKLVAFETQEQAEAYVADKVLVADRMSLDFGSTPAAPDDNSDAETV